MIINDPSHITGSRQLIQSVSQKAIDLDYDGLMIESHIDPDNAWSDAKQQVTPERLAEILNDIKWRTETVLERASATPSKIFANKSTRSMMSCSSC